MAVKRVSPPQTAGGCLDYETLMATIKYLLDASWGAEWGRFSPDGPNVTETANVEYPVIVHYLGEMRPGVIGNNTREIKPRYRYTYLDEDANGNHPPMTRVYGQTLDAEIIFEVWEETNSRADQLAKNFRQTMAAFTGYLKEKGVKEIHFMRLEPDLSNGRIKDAYKVRRLTYFVRFEEISEVPTDLIRVIEVVEKKLEAQARIQLQKDQNGE